MTFAKAEPWRSEAAMCVAFRTHAEADGWIVHPEQGGVDFVLEADTVDLYDIPPGFQIAVEAKLDTSFAVLAQAIAALDSGRSAGPDEVAVLVPKAPEGFIECAQALGIGVFVMPPPPLPQSGPKWTWKRGKPAHFARPWSGLLRVHMAPGQPGPRVVSPWKIDAIRLCMLAHERPLTREDFTRTVVKIRTFVDRGWIQACQHEGRRGVAFALQDVPGRPDRVYPEIVAALAKQEQNHG